MFVFGAACGVLLCLVAAACGASVYRGDVSRIRGFDPAQVSDVPSVQAVSKVYEGLVQYAYLKRPYGVEPLLAESMPEITSNGTVYTFHLRRGIRFQNDACFTATQGAGRELTADDFVYSLKRVADLRTGSSGYWTLRGHIVGLDAYRDLSAQGRVNADTAVEGLQAVDRYTLRIVLTHPFPGLLWMLAMNYAYAVPREAVACYGNDFVSHPVGTGPYILDTWVPNHKLVFVRNPVWKASGRTDAYPETGSADDARRGLLDDTGQPVPFIDRIEQHVVGDPSTQWLLFLDGQLDMSGISRDNWDAVVTADGQLAGNLVRRGLAMESAPALDVSYVGYNMGDPVLGTNRFLRQALQAAFDREQWVRFHNRRVQPAEGPVPPALRGVEAAASPFPFDVARARQLMVAAGYPEGRDPGTGRRLELTLDVGSGGAETRETVEVLASFMEKVGVVIHLSVNNWPAFLAKLEHRQAQMFLMNWVADYPDAENFLQLFYGPNETPGANHCNYHNPAFDRLYEQARATTNSEERLGLYARMERMVQDDCPWLFMHHSMSFSVRQPWVRNYKPHDFPYGMIKYYRIAPH